MVDLSGFIKSCRPTLTDNSIKTYNSILKNLYKRVFSDIDNGIDINKFNDSTAILEYLKNTPIKTRKTILSALVVVTEGGANKQYLHKMLEDIESYKSGIATHEKSQAEKNNWIEPQELEKVFNELKTRATALYKKKEMTMADYQEIQNFIIVALLGGKFIPPRRLKDYTEFKIKNINACVDNFLNCSTLSFNTYKTANTYGQQDVRNIPIVLKNILNKWIKINPTEYLLFDMNYHKLSSITLNQRLNKIFGRKVGVNLLRHSFLTDKYFEHVKEHEAVKNTMKDMGSSTGQLDVYVKN